jgi:hypothetical protein
MFIQPVDFLTKAEEHTVEKRQMILEKLERHEQKNETKSLPLTICKNKLKVDETPKFYFIFS